MASKSFDRMFSQTVAATNNRLDEETKPPEPDSKASTSGGAAADAVKEILQAWKDKDYFRCGRGAWRR
jgi:hypothetical protein